MFLRISLFGTSYTLIHRSYEHANPYNALRQVSPEHKDRPSIALRIRTRSAEFSKQVPIPFGVVGVEICGLNLESFSSTYCNWCVGTVCRVSAGPRTTSQYDGKYHHCTEVINICVYLAFWLAFDAHPRLLDANL